MTETILLADNGASPFTITVPDAAMEQQFAASELQRYIEKISGARLPITSKPPSDAHILLQCSGQNGFAIDIAPERIRIAGSDPATLLHAAYIFVEMLGCRWYAPEHAFYGADGGAVVPRETTLRLNVQQRAGAPAFAFRKKFVEEGRSHTVDSLLQLIDWMPKVGLNIFACPINWSHQGRAVWDNWRERLTPELKKRGLGIEVGGHGYENFLPTQDIATNPAWGGMRPDGAREADSIRRTFCTTNEAAVARLTSNLAEYLRTHPEIDIFDLWPPDTRDWCTCRDCMTAGPIQERHARLVNAIAALAEKLRPDLKVSFSAYYEPTTPPADTVLADNVMIDFCPITRSYQDPIYESSNDINHFYNERLRAWFDTPNFAGSLCIYTYYRKYAWRSLPILLPRLIADELRYYRSLGVDGIGSYSEPADWWTYELQHYVLARLSWNPDTDLDALLDDYLGHRYGPAASPMRDLILSLGDFLPGVARIPGTRFRDPADTALDTYEFWQPTARAVRAFTGCVDACRTQLTKAEKLASAERTVLDRLAKWRVLVDYVDLEVQARGLALALAERATGGFLEPYIEVMAKMRDLATTHRDSGLILYDEWATYAPERL